jgi:hypothetical protein
MAICSFVMAASHVARLPVAQSTEDSRDAITRKTAILELVRDEQVESFVVHAGGLSRLAKSQIHPAPRTAEVQAGYATNKIKRQPGPHGLVDRKNVS